MIWTVLFIVNIMSKVLSEIENIDCKMSENGKDYNGKVNITYGGLRCQAWNDSLPHFHIPTKDNFLKNYCRNPSLDRQGVWCFTDSPIVRRQYCNVSYCKEIICKTGISYIDNKQITLKGFQCLPWFNSPEMFWNFPDNSLEEAKNYCRNPNYSFLGPWCYIMFKNYSKYDVCFENYCKENFDSSCPVFDSLNGPINIIVEGGAHCQKQCVLNINYNDSDPRMKLPTVLFEYRLLKNYSDFLSDFNFSMEFNVVGFASLRETRFNYFICTDRNGLYLQKDKLCVFQFVCHRQSETGKYPVYSVTSIDNICLIRQTGSTACQNISIIKNPPGFHVFPNKFVQFQRNNDQSFQIMIVKHKSVVLGLTVPKIKRIFISAVDCVNISTVDDNVFLIVLNTILSCKCRFLTYILVRVILEGFQWISIERKYYFFYTYSGIKCDLMPSFPAVNKPIITKSNTFFNFSAREYSLNFKFPIGSFEKCMVEDSIQDSSFHLVSHKCCISICYIDLPIWLQRYDGWYNLGSYNIIKVDEGILAFKPDLVYLLLRERTITCEMKNVLGYYGLIRKLILMNDDGSEREITDYKLTNYVDKFKLKCLCYLVPLKYKFIVTLDTIIRVFMTVKDFKAVIKWNSVLKINDSIYCTITTYAPPMSVKLTWDIRRTSSFYSTNYIIENRTESNTLVLTFPVKYEIGILTALCIASLEDDVEDSYYTYTKYFWISSDLKGQSGELIYPTYQIIRIPDTIGCSHPETYNISINITRMKGDTNFIIYNDFFIVTEELRSGLYMIICIFHLKTYSLSTSATKLIYNKNIFFYPDLPFYLLNKHGFIKCLQDPDAVVTDMTTKLIMDAVRLPKEGLLHQEGFLYFSLTSPGLVELSCNLIVTLDTLSQNINSDDFPYVKKETSVTKLTKKAYLIKPFRLYILESNKHFINETITCRTDSEHLLKHLYLFQVRWDIYPYINYHFFNFTTTTIYFPSTAPPDTYHFRCTFDYQIFTWMIVKEQIFTETIVNLTAVIAFIIEPKRSVFIEQDRICCFISAFVEIHLTMLFNETMTESDATICKILPMKFISKADVITCILVYNQREKTISREVVYLAVPYALYITPDDLKLDSNITCFPYQTVFSVENHMDLNFSISLIVVDQPINQIIIDVIKDYNMSLYTSRNGVLKLNEFLNSFGLYKFICTANISILNQTHELHLSRTITVSGFSDEIAIHKNVNYEPYLLIGMVTSLHCVFFPLLLVIISVAIMIHEAHMFKIIQTLKTIGCEYHISRKSLVKKIEAIYINRSQDALFEELFKILYAYTFISKMHKEDQEEMTRYNLEQPSTRFIEASLRTCISNLSDQTNPKGTTLQDFFHIMTNINKMDAHDMSSEQLSNHLKNMDLPSMAEDDELWNPRHKKMMTYDGILPSRIVQKRIELINNFQMHDNDMILPQHKDHKTTMLVRKSHKLKHMAPAPKFGEDDLKWLEDIHTETEKIIVPVKEKELENGKDNTKLNDVLQKIKESLPVYEPQRKTLRIVGIH